VRVDVGRWTFDVRVGGPDDARAVLLLHGFPENSRMWDAVALRLHTAGLRTLAPDQRGYSPGARPADPAAYSAVELTGDAVGLLDACGLAAVDLVGHDWGAVVAWNVAARHPDRVRTLTAVSVPHPLAHAWALRNDPEQQRLSSYLDLFRTPGKAEEVLLADGARRLRAMLAPLPAGQIEAFVLPLLEPGALTGALNWYRGMSRRDLDLGPVAAPTTYVWGTEDLGVARAAAERCAEHVTGPYRFVPLRGISHWAPEQAPDAVAEAVLDRLHG
jgi:pimeloyl-ACP methyl ester carboxylesterase